MAQDLAEKRRGLGAIFATSTLPNPHMGAEASQPRVIEVSPAQ